MPAEPHDRLLSAGRVAMDLQYVGAGVAVAVICAMGILAWIPGALDRFLNVQPWWLKAFPAVGVVLGLVAWRSIGALCTVYLAPHGLRIIRGKTEILVPLDQVKRVDRSGGMRVTIGSTSRAGGDTNETITIAFRERTPLGTTIRFLAPFLGAGPLVEELRRRAGFQASGKSWPSDSGMT